LFWEVVLVSALGESLDRASLAAARKVFVDGFLAARDAYVLLAPQAPLAELFGEALPGWLVSQGVQIHTSAAVQKILPAAGGRIAIQQAGAEPQAFDGVVLSVPWHQAPELLADEWHRRLPWLAHLADWPASPISGAHLWFDRPITSLAHAVLVGRLGQWLFNRNRGESTTLNGEYYYQVVISASRNLAGRDRQEIAAELSEELRAIWPEARNARLLRSKIVTEVSAVFSISPGSERWRPRQATDVEGLFVAGDWTDTGWPATLEGAVRSGYLAAEEVTASFGNRQRFLTPDLERSWLAKWLIEEG
jgi:squalene-associated FAD-dependent desaturase